MQPSSGISLIGTILTLGFLVLSVALMKIGFWPRRRGTIPHCRGCGYVLVGNQSGTCPECGRELTAAHIVRGERPRRKGFGAAGIVLVMLGALIFTAPLIWQVNWYQFLPASWIIGDLGSPDQSTATRAWAELMRRRSAGELSEQIEKKLTESALKEQAASTPGPLLGAMLDYLGQRFLDKKLTAQQAEQFFLNSVNVKLKTRPVVLAGERFPVQLAHGGRAPANGWLFQITSNVLMLGDEKINIGGAAGGSGIGGSGAITVQAGPRPPGTYPLEAAVMVAFFHAPLGGGTKPVWSREMKLTAQVKVQPPQETDTVELVDQPKLAEVIKKSIKITNFQRQKAKEFPVQFDLNPPINVAFAVLVVVDGREYRLGDIAANAYSQSGTMLNPTLPVDVKPGKVKVILRSDPAVARATIDQFQIWKGEIVIEGVQVIDKPNINN